jgi:putative transposase
MPCLNDPTRPRHDPTPTVPTNNYPNKIAGGPDPIIYIGVMEKFRNKYRVPSARAAWWNYGWAGAYFITICTHGREHFFGEIQNRKMILSNAGLLADVFWHEIPNHAKHVELGSFVVMPNHIHGILILNGGISPTVETRHALSLRQRQQQQQTEPPQPRQPFPQQRFQNQGKNTVSSIIGSYKSAVTKHANRLGLEFGWQARFHDHIIRDDPEFQRINDYIEMNVENWKDDRFFAP